MTLTLRLKTSPLKNNKYSTAPCPYTKDPNIMMHNLSEDIVDFEFEKRNEDPANRHTWVYTARFRGYVFQRVSGPKSIVEHATDM
jgi:hypothetical protein